MVFRINGSGLNSSALRSNLGNIQASGNQLSSAVGGAVVQFEELAQKNAEAFFETSMAQFDMDLESDLRNISSQALGGEGYEQQGMEAYYSRRDSLYEMAGNDPYKRAFLDEAFSKDNEIKLQQGLRNGQIELDSEYSIFRLSQYVDDTMQDASRMEFYPEGGRYAQFKEKMGFSENGGKYNGVNSEGYVGKYQFGQARLTDFTNAHGLGHIDVKSIQNDPAFQETLADWHFADIDKFIANEGFDAYIGKEVGGVVMTLDGMRAIAHLGGKPGLRKFMKTGGKYNPSDSNGTHLTDYARKFGVDENGAPIYNGAIPDLKNDPVIKGRMANINAQIDAIPGLTANQRAEMKHEARDQILSSAFDKMANDNPAMAYAALQSGEYDDALNYKFTSSVEGTILSNSQKLFEQDLAMRAKEQDAQSKLQADQKYNDLASWADNGFMGEAPPGISTDEYFSLSPSEREKLDNFNSAHIAVNEARLNGYDAEYMETIKPSGEEFAGEQFVYDAVLKDRERAMVQAQAASEILRAKKDGSPVDMSVKGVPELIDIEWMGGIESAIEQELSMPEMALEFANTFGTIPKSAQKDLVRSMFSDEATAVDAASATIETLARNNPEALSSMKKEDIDLALGIASRARLMPPDQARDEARKALNDNIGRKEFFDKLWDKSSDRAEDYANMINEVAGGEAVSLRARADMIGLYEDALFTLKDSEAAVNKVRVMMSKNYSQTTFSQAGSEFAFRPPEKVFSVWGDPQKDGAWQMEQLADEIGGDYDNFILENVDGSDLYHVFGVKDGEIIDVSADKGGLFTFDPSEEIALRDANANVEDYREMQSRIRELNHFIQVGSRWGFDDEGEWLADIFVERYTRDEFNKLVDERDELVRQFSTMDISKSKQVINQAQDPSSEYIGEAP